MEHFPAEDRDAQNRPSAAVPDDPDASAADPSPAETPAAENAPLQRSDLQAAVIDASTGEPVDVVERPRRRGRFFRRRRKDDATDAGVAPIGAQGAAEGAAEAAPGTAEAKPSRRWRNLAMALGLVFATLAGGSGSLIYSNRNNSAAGGTTATPSVAATAARTATPKPSPTPRPLASVVTLGTPAPDASGPILPATVTFHEMMLDSAADPVGNSRMFLFTSDGPGTVSVQVVAAVPLANSEMCLQANEEPETCVTGATPEVVGTAPAGDHTQWTATLVATDGGSTPVVDVAITWQTRAPAITLSQGRFQGSPNPDSLRGFTATFKTRAAGSVRVAAAWAPATTTASLTLTDVTGSPAMTVAQSQYAALTSIAPEFTHAVTAATTYQVAVVDAGVDSGRPELTAMIVFP